ncbi:MAG: alpha/beta hydrolase [Clostridiales bacterium]|nr:alpha/beta hydrolase [Clostridiales bacterium]
MALEHNREVLTQVIFENAVIRHISKHRNADGTLDTAGNMKIWNDAVARFDQIPLWENGAPGFEISLDPLQIEPSIIFIPAPDGQQRGTVIVAHGGGFAWRTGCEGFHVADYFNHAGFAVAVLTYRLVPFTRRDAMADMQRAIRTLRHRKMELGISDKIAVMGFSAGGMLSGNCATHFDFGELGAEDPVQRQSCRPDACIVGYGAFTSTSFPRPFSPVPVPEETLAEEQYLSVERNLTAQTPPFFIWQTNSDDPRLSMNLAWQLQCANIPFELHCFPGGVHGLALADGNNDLGLKLPHVARWAELCAEWLSELGF